MQRSRFREALADVPQKPSRGHCCDGFLHRPKTRTCGSLQELDRLRHLGQHAFLRYRTLTGHLEHPAGNSSKWG